MREIQYWNVRSGLFPMKMELKVGEGKTDARQLIGEHEYVGVVEKPGVVVHYPAGMESLGAETGSAFSDARDEIKRLTGITWAFKLHLYIVPVRDTTGGFRITIPLRNSRELRLPLLVVSAHPACILPSWSRGIGHEITEGSMLASAARRELILGDYCIGGSGIVNETRWFRDGVSDYAGDILNRRLFGERYQPPGEIYHSLLLVREDILYWTNCNSVADNDLYYDASLAIVHEIVNRSGEDAIARIMQIASQERYISGHRLRESVEKATGLDLRSLLRTYQVTWLGMTYRDTMPSPLSPSLTLEGNKVRIARVYPGSPADKWKLKSGDTILSVDSHNVVSAAWLTHYVASRRPGERIQVEIERAGERIPCLMVTTAQPVEGRQ